jgi:hypothetical protein
MPKKNADGETRTRKDNATRTSSVRVYQFRHIRTNWLQKTRFFSLNASSPKNWHGLMTDH